MNHSRAGARKKNWTLATIDSSTARQAFSKEEADSAQFSGLTSTNSGLATAMTSVSVGLSVLV